MVGVLGLGVTITGLIFHIKVAIIAGLGLYSIFTFPSFSITLQAIGKRTGPYTDLVATANIFTVGEIVSAVVFCIHLALKTYYRTDNGVLIGVMSAMIFLSAVCCLMLAKGFNRIDNGFNLRENKK